MTRVDKQSRRASAAPAAQVPLPGRPRLVRNNSAEAFAWPAPELAATGLWHRCGTSESRESPGATVHVQTMHQTLSEPKFGCPVTSRSAISRTPIGTGRPRSVYLTGPRAPGRKCPVNARFAPGHPGLAYRSHLVTHLISFRWNRNDVLL